jgi:hypothetical protein
LLVVTGDKSGGLKQDLVHHDVKLKANQEGEKLVDSHEHTQLALLKRACLMLKHLALVVLPLGCWTAAPA